MKNYSLIVSSNLIFSMRNERFQKKKKTIEMQFFSVKKKHQTCIEDKKLKNRKQMEKILKK